jgi:hypothetical protein
MAEWWECRSVHPAIARALVLFGREMLEDYTPSGSRGGTAKPASVYNGAEFEYKEYKEYTLSVVEWKKQAHFTYRGKP